MSRRGKRKEKQENVDSLRALREGEKVEVEESQLRSAARRDRVDKGKEEAARVRATGLASPWLKAGG